MTRENQSEFQVVGIAVQGLACTYKLAHELAETIAGETLGEYLLVAWYDGQTSTEHPTVPECQHKPGWLAYGEGHGGQLRINVNREEFCFIYAPLA